MKITQRHALQGAAAMAVLIKEDRRSVDGRADGWLLKRDGQSAVVEVASGHYRFTTE